MTVEAGALEHGGGLVVGLPTTFGTSTGLGPFETLIRTGVPSTTTVPGEGLGGDAALVLVRVHLDDARDEAGARELRDASSTRLPDDARDRDLRLARGDLDDDDGLLVDAGALRRLLLEDEALLDVGVGHAAHLGTRSRSVIWSTAWAWFRATTYGTGRVSAPFSWSGSGAEEDAGHEQRERGADPRSQG